MFFFSATQWLAALAIEELCSKEGSLRSRGMLPWLVFSVTQWLAALAIGSFAPRVTRCARGDSLRSRGLAALEGTRCARGDSLRSRGLAALKVSLQFFTHSTSHYLVFLTLLSQGSCAPRMACCACWGKLRFHISITQPLTSKQTSFFS